MPVLAMDRKVLGHSRCLADLSNLATNDLVAKGGLSSKAPLGIEAKIPPFEGIVLRV